jgi:hypothetical protein
MRSSLVGEGADAITSVLFRMVDGAVSGLYEIVGRFHGLTHAGGANANCNGTFLPRGSLHSTAKSRRSQMSPSTWCGAKSPQILPRHNGKKALGTQFRLQEMRNCAQLLVSALRVFNDLAFGSLRGPPVGKTQGGQRLGCLTRSPQRLRPPGRHPRRKPQLLIARSAHGRR